MRRVLLMVVAAMAFVGFGASTAAASGGKAGCTDTSKPGCSEKRCANPGGGNSKHGCTPPKPCKPGYVRTKSGKCKPKPVTCQPGYEKVHGKCVPKCKDNQFRDKHGKCRDKPPVCQHKPCVPPPPSGPCSKADLVLLEDLIAGTGALACLFFGDNAPNASDKPGGNCPEATLALPIDHLIGACLYLPPADVGGEPGGGTPSLPPLPDFPGVPDLPGLPNPCDCADSLLSALMGKLG